MALTRDLKSNVGVARVISPISPSATGVITGQVVDTKDCNGVLFVLMNGASTTNTIAITPTVYSGTATDSLASAAAAELIGTEAAAAFGGDADANTQSTIGYIGSNRYVRVDLLVAAAATGVHAVAAIKFGVRKAPVS